MATTLGPVGLDRRLRWLLVGRLGVAIFGMAAILSGPLSRGALRIAPDNSATYHTLLAACFINLAYLVLLRRFRNHRLLAWVQIAGDIVLESLLVYFSGVDSVYAYLYFATVIAAAMILSAQASLLTASLSTILLSAAFIAHFLQARAGPGTPTGPLPRVLADLDALVVHIAFFTLSLHVVAVLAGRLAAEARRVRILNDEILQTMGDGVITVDRDGRVAFINRPARRLLDLPDRERIEGLSFEALGAEPVGRALLESLRSGEPVQTAVRVPRPDGSALSLDLVTSVLEDAESRIRGVVAILHDASLRETVVEMSRRAERFRAIAEMSTGIAHEIRNPLTSIRGAAQALRGDTARPEDSRLLAVIVRESDRLEGIIDNFLKFARHKPPVPRPGEVRPLLQDVADLLRARPDAARTAIVVEADGAVPARFDPDQIRQILLNLGLNALDALAEQDGERRLTFRARREEPGANAPSGKPGRVWLEVVDTGAGIDPAHWPRLFEPFFSTKPRGTGLGLAISKRIVEAHGGEITFETGVGKGTTFRIALPG
jgi:two-component system sensor histidine kinase PilS (NtrC family)